VDLMHDRTYYGVHLGDTVVDISMETRGPDHVAELIRGLVEAGYVPERVL
jgi:threonine dehydratase